MDTHGRTWLALALLVAAVLLWIGLRFDPTPAPILHVPTEGHP